MLRLKALASKNPNNQSINLPFSPPSLPVLSLAFIYLEWLFVFICYLIPSLRFLFYLAVRVTLLHALRYALFGGAYVSLALVPLAPSPKRVSWCLTNSSSRYDVWRPWTIASSDSWSRAATRPSRSWTGPYILAGVSLHSQLNLIQPSLLLDLLPRCAGKILPSKTLSMGILSWETPSDCRSVCSNLLGQATLSLQDRGTHCQAWALFRHQKGWTRYQAICSERYWEAGRAHRECLSWPNWWSYSFFIQNNAYSLPRPPMEFNSHPTKKGQKAAHNQYPIVGGSVKTKGKGPFPYLLENTRLHISCGPSQLNEHLALRVKVYSWMYSNGCSPQRSTLSKKKLRRR